MCACDMFQTNPKGHTEEKYKERKEEKKNEIKNM